MTEQSELDSSSYSSPILTLNKTMKFAGPGDDVGGLLYGDRDISLDQTAIETEEESSEDVEYEMTSMAKPQNISPDK